MFNDFENIYPSKPEMPIVGVKEMLQKNLMIFVIIALLLIFYFNENLVLIAGLFGVLLLHELGHFIGMKLFGFNDKKILYLPVFSHFITQNTIEVSQKKYLITLLLGPLPGILIGTGLLYAYTKTQNELLLNFSTLFLAINIFSLLPLDPLDGGKIIETMFFPTNDKAKLYFVLTSSFIFIVIGFYFQMYIIMIFGFLMAFKVKSIQKNDNIHHQLNDQDIDYKKPYKLLTDKEYWKIRSVFLDNNPKIKSLIPSSDTIWENEKLLIDQINQILKLKISKDASFGFKLLMLIIISAVVYYPAYLVNTYWDSVFQPIIDNAYL
jgi:Zn-dependent protease